VSVRAPHLLANFKAEVARLWIKLPSAVVSNFKKRRTIFTWCRRKNADVFFLQETHSNKATEDQWQREWGGKMLFSHGSLNSCGTTILINNKANCTVLCTVPDPLSIFMHQTKVKTRSIF